MMSEFAKAVYDQAMQALRALPSDDRAEVISALRYNDDFCSDCGRDTPGGERCHCQNDE